MPRRGKISLSLTVCMFSSGLQRHSAHYPHPWRLILQQHQPSTLSPKSGRDCICFSLEELSGHRTCLRCGRLESLPSSAWRELSFWVHPSPTSQVTEGAWEGLLWTQVQCWLSWVCGAAQASEEMLPDQHSQALLPPSPPGCPLSCSFIGNSSMPGPGNIHCSSHLCWIK